MIPKGSDKPGSRWQVLLDDLTKIAVENGTIAVVTGRNTNSDKVKYCLDEPFVRDRLQCWIQDIVDGKTFCKSSDISNQYRAKGNKVYSGEKPENATELYTKALFYAPKDSESVGLSYGNRSAVLQFLGLHKECIDDVDRALEGKATDRQRHARLLIRRAKSCLGSGNTERAKKSLDSARKVILGVPLPSDSKVTKMLSELEEINQRLSSLQITEGETNKIVEMSSEDVLEYFKNEFSPNLEFSGASAAVELRKSDQKGRHVVATRDIEIGEILFLDEPFAFVCLPDPSYSHCHFCCRKTIAPIPCDQCAAGAYCSFDCRDKGWTQFHRWECGAGLELLYNVGIAHLGLRVALVGLTEDQEKYRQVRQLLDHIDDLHPEDLFQYTVIASALVMYLKKFTQFFSFCNETPEEFGGTILLHIAQLVCNGNAIVECLLGRNEEPFGVTSERQVRIGTAIYPSTSMMNHSCDSNVISSYLDKYIVVKAAQFVPKGAEVFNSYGLNFRRQPTSERQELLRGQYFFVCSCDPCRSSSDFLDKFLGCPCRKCDGTIIYKTLQCTKCQEKLPVSFQQDVDKADVLFARAKDYVKLGEHENGIKCAEEALDYFTKHFYKHNREVLECKDLIARSCACIGQFKKSGQLIEECVEGAKELYGCVSIEVAGEVLKLTDVVVQMMKSRNPDRALFDRAQKHAEDSEKTLRLLYSPYHPRYLDLVDNIRSLRSFNN